MNYPTNRDLSPDHAIPPTPREQLLRGETGPPLSRGAPPPIVAGLEGLAPGDLRLPLLKLKQPSMPYPARVPEGSWFLTSDEEGHALSRGLVLLEARKERSLLLPVHRGKQAIAKTCQHIRQETGVDVPPSWRGPVCWSRDRIRPVQQEGIPTLSDKCATCPMVRRKITGGGASGCNESYRLLFWDLAAELPCVLFARGPQLRYARELLTQLHVASRRQELPVWAFVLGLSAKRHEGESGGHHYLPVFSRPYPTTHTEQIERYAAVRQACGAFAEGA